MLVFNTSSRHPRATGAQWLALFASWLPRESEWKAPNPARWCDGSAFSPSVHSTAVSGTPTIRGTQARQAGPAPQLQPLTGTSAGPEREVAGSSGQATQRGGPGLRNLHLEQGQSPRQPRGGKDLQTHKRARGHYQGSGLPPTQTVNNWSFQIKFSRQ